MEKVDLSECLFGDGGLQQFLPGLLSCTCLQEVNLRWCRISEQHICMACIGEILLAENRQTLDVVDPGAV